MLKFITRTCCVGWLFVLAACGGGGGGDDPPPTNGEEVVVSGRITFDRIEFSGTLGGGLNPDEPIEAPARHVLVEAIASNGATVLASTSTDENGEYSLTVPADTNMQVRAKAQMLKTGTAPTWNFRVLDNTSDDALYALVSSEFNSGDENRTRDLHAASGWNGSSYTGERAAAPFAILDTVFEAKELIRSADASIEMPALDLFWSPSNRPSDTLCADDGDITTSFYESFSVDGPFDDECGQPLPSGIYILGDFQTDTDEFDAHVIAHEFGHYFEDRYSRSDSIGGPHGLGESLDMRLAFGEGWGNAYAGMSLDNPIYRDSYSGVDADFGFDIEEDGTAAQGDVEGWYSESSVAEILWDLYDEANEAQDTLELGFAPIYEVMTGPQVETEALTSIFTFAEGLLDVSSADASAIRGLLAAEDIAATDAFAEDEENDGGDELVLPIYRDIAFNQQIAGVCVRATAGSNGLNKLGNRRFLRFANSTDRVVVIQAVGTAANPPSEVPATDPDIIVYSRGEFAALAESEVQGSETTGQIELPAGEYVIEVYDFDMPRSSGANDTPRCMTVSIAG